MKKKISPPFFEIGPKSYLYGDEVVELAKIADKMSEKYDVQVLFTCPLISIQKVVEETKNLIVLAPHMDFIKPGRGIAETLPESLVAVGVDGVMLNHAEKPLQFVTLERTINRAKELDLLTVVCASTIAEIRAVAELEPDVLVAEPSELIGTGKTSDLTYMQISEKTIKSVNKNIMILQAAGISNGEDVYRVFSNGADATGSSSAIANAKNKSEIVEEMISAVRKAWDIRHN